MPYSERQKRFAGAELGRMKAGKATKSSMTKTQLKDFASGPIKKPKGGK